MVPAQGAAVPWWYAKELQGVRRLVEQQTQTVKNMEAELRGLQRRMTQTARILTQRVEVLESTKPPVAGACHKESVSRDLHAVAASVTNLESRFECFRSEIAAQLTASLAVFEECRGQAGCKALGAKDDLQICFSDASSLIIQHSANSGASPREKTSAKSSCLPWKTTGTVSKTPEFGSIVLPPLPCHGELAVPKCNIHEKVMRPRSARTHESSSNSSLDTDACSTDANGSIDTNLLSASSLSAGSSKSSSDWEDSTTARLHEVMSHMIRQVVRGEQRVPDPQSTNHFQLGIPQPQSLSVPLVMLTAPLSPLPNSWPGPCRGKSRSSGGGSDQQQQ